MTVERITRKRLERSEIRLVAVVRGDYLARTRKLELDRKARSGHHGAFTVDNAQVDEKKILAVGGDRLVFAFQNKLLGLADGLDLAKDTKEGKLIAALIDMVDALAEKVDELDCDVEELNDYCEELDEDLHDVEEVLLDEYDECDGECDCCDCDDCDCYDDTYEVECPACGEKVCFDEDVDPTDLACPACGAKLLEGEE